MPSKKVICSSAREALALAGENDSLLRRLESELGVELYLRQSPETGDFAVEVRGSAARVSKALRHLRERLKKIRSGRGAENEGAAELPGLPGALNIDIPPMPENGIYRAHSGRVVRARTPNQQAYVDAILANELVFGIGPAGTGKTFLAVACALRALETMQVQRIVVSRPVVEAGERLGFLPGDILEKMNPYLKPVYDSFFFMLGPDRLRTWSDMETIEIVPLAYMRGRTFEESFIILDEAQNTTPQQMKMFLTRLGNGSKMVVTGDATQNDLEKGATSGLVVIEDILKSVPEAVFRRLSGADVVRPPIVKSIISAYEDWESKR